MDITCDDVVGFWREAGPSRWFAKDDDFDTRFRERFLAAHEAAVRGDLAAWERDATGALALILLLDQFPRNCFRGTPRVYASDAQARAVADRALQAGFERQVEQALQVFFCLPFSHSEDLADQERSVRTQEALGLSTINHALGHRDIIRRFGRFPHRNAILGRVTTREEQAFLDAGGFKG